MAGRGIKSIAEDAMPGWEFVGAKRASGVELDTIVAEPDQVGVDVGELRRKYLKSGDAFPPADLSSARVSPKNDESKHDMQLARMRLRSAPDNVIGTKTVLVDVTAKKVIGKQG